MNTDYLDRANACINLAGRAKTAQLKEAWLLIATGWLSLVRQEDQSPEDLFKAAVKER